jgi:hypothetical protein
LGGAKKTVNKRETCKAAVFSAGLPDWVNFRTLGIFIILAGVLKITEAAQIFNCFLHGKRYAPSLTQRVWATFWATFSQTHLVTLLKCPGKVLHWVVIKSQS